MKHYQLFSRRDTDRKVDFRPDQAPLSPYVQLRRLSAYLEANVAKPEDITDCSEGLAYLREYQYRKVFTGTSHDDFVALDQNAPEAIDWLLAIHEIEVAHREQSKKQSDTPARVINTPIQIDGQVLADSVRSYTKRNPK